jgi:hypothetical protein
LHGADRWDLRRRGEWLEGSLAIVRAARLIVASRPPPGHRPAAADQERRLREEERRLMAQLDDLDEELASS